MNAAVGKQARRRIGVEPEPPPQKIGGVQR